MDHSTHPAYGKLYPAPGAEEPAAFFPAKISRNDSEHLDALESQSIFLIREAFHHFKNLCMPWSMGKDSNVLIWLSKKAFLGHIPYPLLHIDTTYEFPEMIEYRDWAVKHYGLNLIVKINEDARAAVFPHGPFHPPRLRQTLPRTRRRRARCLLPREDLAQR
jgi:3'-phosphoadenosine 5'-phosphosulfate sulfotransferase (PAPS reductase)/FAD synthetase